MNIDEAKEKIKIVKDKLLEMQKVVSFMEKGMFEESEETGGPYLEPGEAMSTVYPEKNSELHKCWEEIQQSAPSGFLIEGNLLRHLSFNQAHDWLDISKKDIPRELIRIEEYTRRLFLVEYLDSLHPEISKATDLILNGDLEMALKAVFASLDTKIRFTLSAKPDEKTVPLIGKSFKNGTLVAPRAGNTDGARNFLQGVIGYYRNGILHNPLSIRRNQVETSLSLFTLAHEAFNLFDVCSKNIVRE